MNYWTRLTELVDPVLMALDMNVNHPFDSSANGIAVDMGDFTIFFFEDPSDGYRSSMAEPMISDGPLYSFGCSPNYIRVPVEISLWDKNNYGGDANGVNFIDTRNDKLILRVGTDNIDDYYPSFVIDYRPQNIFENASREITVDYEDDE